MNPPLRSHADNVGLWQGLQDGILDFITTDHAPYNKPILRQELLTKCGWSPFEGWNLTGWPVVTFVNGEVVFEQGKVNAIAHGKALQFTQ
jgi:dihydroorotase